jgi:hypothetical protein
MFPLNSFQQSSDESVDVGNRFLLTTECQNMKDNLDFPLIVSKLLRMSHLKAYIHIFKIRRFSLYIMLSMILQLGGLANLIIGISSAVIGDTFDAETSKGKFQF